MSKRTNDLPPARPTHLLQIEMYWLNTTPGWTFLINFPKCNLAELERQLMLFFLWVLRRLVMHLAYTNRQFPTFHFRSTCLLAGSVL